MYMINVYNLLQFYCTILFSIRDQNKLDNNFFVNYNFFDQKSSDQTETQYKLEFCVRHSEWEWVSANEKGA